MHTAARECEVKGIKLKGLTVNDVPAVGKEHLGHVFDVDVEAHARRRYRSLPSPNLNQPEAGISAQFGSAQRPGRCTRSHGHSAASQAATASASGTSSSAWLARTHDWTVTSAADSEG